MWPFKKKNPESVEKKAAQLPARHPRVRNFNAAQISRFTNDWTTFSGTPAAEILGALATLRARSRDLAKNNAYASRFLNMVKTNVVGHKGIGLQVRAKNFDGKLDEPANNRIEEHWRKWGKVGSCTVDGRLSWVDCQKLFIETLIRDGEVLTRLWPGWKDNPYGFAIQFIEPDHLDQDLNTVYKNGNKIVMGVEVNKWDRPVAYHLLVKHPGEAFPGQFGKTHDRIPANEIIHSFITERAKQPRGVPWMTPSMLRNKMLDGLEDAAVTAARVGAGKMGFFHSPDGQGYTGDDQEQDGNAVVEITNAEPGTFEQLPDGVQFSTYDPTYPNNEFEPFSKSILRGIASGLNVSYVSLANNLEGVSYSSIRKGELEDRDSWRMLQTFTIEHFSSMIQEVWLTMSLTTGVMGLPLAKFDKFNAPLWKPRGWQWVDPQREVRANVEAITNGLKSLGDVHAEQGLDTVDVLDRLEEEKQMSDDRGLNLPIFTGDQNGQKIPDDPEDN